MSMAAAALAFCAVAMLAHGVDCYSYSFETHGDTFDTSVSSTKPTFSAGNTVVRGAGDTHDWDGIYGSKQVSSGTGVHTWTVKVLSYEDHGSNVFELAIGLTTNTLSTWFWSQPESYGYMAEDGRAVNAKSSCCHFDTGYGTSYRAGDVVSVTYDSDANTVAFGVNGADQGVWATDLGPGPFRLAVALGDNKEEVEMNGLVTGQGEESETWSDYPDTVCKEIGSHNDDGGYTRLKNIEPNTLDKCKELCVEAETECLGVEYYESTGRCDLFNTAFTHGKKKTNRICSARDKHIGELETYSSAATSQWQGSGGLIMGCATVGLVAAVGVIATVYRRSRAPAKAKRQFTVLESDA